VDGGDKPIYSAKEHDPALAEVIDTFVVGLAERVDALQDATSRQELDVVGGLCAQVTREAGALGFAPLARCAARIEVECEAGRAEEVRKGVVELTDLARRIRLGHRGALA